ncbi:MAG: arylsulfatase [Akkermansiaceae bacterium]
MKSFTQKACQLLAVISCGASVVTADAIRKPNVVLVITDDQGYGDLGFTGNTVIQTPHIDKLRDESVLLDNFHVDPTCGPTRSALMTGRYSNRVGVWHTVQGRNMLRRRETTIANVFQGNGYKTGLFGKWHLGDNYPYRPEDRGFDQVVSHAAGGVGQTPDYWGNDYFDDTYMLNGKLQRFEGYCTDVWFDQGIKFIKENKDQPFFAYIAPNAPHIPLFCPEEYTKPYIGNPEVSIPEYYGMVTNIDDNMAKLIQFLREEGLEENTILIYMTDNGTTRGVYEGRGYDGGMRGLKAERWEGGHRVPFIMRWPAGGIEAGKTVKNITAHLDVMPTLVDLCQLDAPKLDYDGKSLRDLIYTKGENWEPRTLVVESQRILDPEKWRESAVMTDRWRLVNGTELYDLSVDPRQANDVAVANPEVVKTLRASYDEFWQDVSKDHEIRSHIVIGADEAPLVALTSHDWLIDMLPPWNQTHILKGEVMVEGRWGLEVEKDGEYEVSLRRWPVELDEPINSGGNGGKAFSFETASVEIGDVKREMVIPEGAKEVTFKLSLKKGEYYFMPRFVGGGVTGTPYYAYVTHQPKAGWQTPAGMGVQLYDPNYGRVPPPLDESALIK